MLDRVILTAAVVLPLWICWFIVSRLNVGLDVSDSAFYIVSYAMHRDIEVTPTVSGWLWASISPAAGVLANRRLGVVFLLICFALLALEGYRNSSDRLIGAAIAFGFTLAGALVFYLPWLPDPSYNLLDLGFIAFGWAGLFGLLSASANSERSIVVSEIAWTVMIGFAVTAVFLAKPTSAALLGPALAGVYLAVTWRGLHARRFATLGLSAIAGLALPFLLMLHIGEGPARVFHTIKNGFEAMATLIPAPLPARLNPQGWFFAYLRDTAKAPIFHQWSALVAVVALVLALSNSLSEKLRLDARIRLGLCILSTIGFSILVWQSNDPSQPYSWINALTIMILALAIGSISLAPRERRQRLALFCGSMIASPLIYVYITGNRWEFNLNTAAGFACASLGVVASALQGLNRQLVTIPGLTLLSLLLLGTANRIEQHPYRLSAHLSELKTPARVGPLEETFLDSPKQAAFYNKLADIRPLVKQLPERPYLIDLSGRAPMVPFQIGAKVPRWPWLLGGYVGSTATFDLVIGEIPKAELAGAWVFQAPGSPGQFPDSILEKYGLNFPAGYVPLATVPIEYVGVEGTLYAPVGVLTDDQIKSLRR